MASADLFLNGRRDRTPLANGVLSRCTCLGVWSDHFGGGLGMSFAWTGGASTTDLTLSAGIGTRIRLTGLWSARVELRARSIDPFHNTVAEWTLGMARRFYPEVWRRGLPPSGWRALQVKGRT
jgi:hypothetical protein